MRVLLQLAPLVLILVFATALNALPFVIDRRRAGRGRKLIQGTTEQFTAPSLTQVVVTTRYLPGSIMQGLFPPFLELDGVPYRGRWGVNVLPVQPGPHSLRAYHRWYFFSEAYGSTTTLDVPPDEPVSAEWQTGWYAGGAGKWTVDGRTSAST